MVQVPYRFCHHYDTPLDLFNPLVLDDPNGELCSDRVRYPTLQPCAAQFLVLRDNVRARCSVVQLLASISLPQRILRIPRTSPRQIGCTRTTPRRQQPRSADHIPQLPGRFLASGQGIWISRETGVLPLPLHRHPPP